MVAKNPSFWTKQKEDFKILYKIQTCYREGTTYPLKNSVAVGGLQTG
jgi:hypothetical protein